MKTNILSTRKWRDNCFPTVNEVFKFEKCQAPLRTKNSRAFQIILKEMFINFRWSGKNSKSDTVPF